MHNGSGWEQRWESISHARKVHECVQEHVYIDWDSINQNIHTLVTVIIHQPLFFDLLYWFVFLNSENIDSLYTLMPAELPQNFVSYTLHPGLLASLADTKKL